MGSLRKANYENPVVTPAVSQVNGPLPTTGSGVRESEISANVKLSYKIHLGIALAFLHLQLVA